MTHSYSFHSVLLNESLKLTIQSHLFPPTAEKMYNIYIYNKKKNNLMMPHMTKKRSGPSTEP